MDRNQFIGLILMLAIMAVYFTFFAPEPPPPSSSEIDSENAAPLTEKNSNAQDSVSFQGVNISEDSIEITRLSELKYGVFAINTLGKEEKITLENDKIKISLSNLGGTIKDVELKEFKNQDQKPVQLVDDQHKIYFLFDHNARRINTSDIFFKTETKNYTDSTVLTFRLQIENNYFEQIYTLKENSYELGYTIRISEGFKSLIENNKMQWVWNAKMPRLERDLTDARNRTTIRYHYENNSADYLSKTSTSHQEEILNEGPLTWVSLNQKYFTSAIIGKGQLQQTFISMDVPKDTLVTKSATIQTELNLSSNIVPLTFFFGPNSYNELKNVADGFSENLELGWWFLPFINKYLILPIFTNLDKVLSNYGLIIILMVIITRLILSPLTYSSHLSMAKMRVLKPELDAIKERNGDDLQKNQTEQMDLYRKAGINPLSGCIPVLLQFPILVSLFYFIPSAIEFRGVSFLWADDLSTYDSILDLPFSIPFYGDHVSLFTILMAVSTLLYTMANSQMTTVQGPMKTLQYIMPVMLLFFFNNYPSALSYYYFIGNVVSYGQIFLFRKLVNEDKIKAVIEENKKKNANKKKSTFQTRLEEAMKASQEAQKKTKKGK